MLDKIKKLFSKPQPKVEEPKEKKPRKPKAELSPKEIATANNEPYISISRINVDPDNVNNGSFELDWNDKFVLNLIKAGYKIKNKDTDTEIVDRWFQHTCRNIALELYEQEVADPEKRDDVRIIRSRDLGNGRTEVS